MKNKDQVKYLKKKNVIYTFLIETYIYPYMMKTIVATYFEKNTHFENYFQRVLGQNQRILKR